MSSARPLDGRVAIVTGGGRGLGKATAQRLRTDGATVVAFDRELGDRDPGDIVAAVSYLVSPGAEFITGQSVNVDGGHRYH